MQQEGTKGGPLLPCKSPLKVVVSSSLILRKLLRETEVSGPSLGFRLPLVIKILKSSCDQDILVVCDLQFIPYSTFSSVAQAFGNI